MGSHKIPNSTCVPELDEFADVISSHYFPPITLTIAHNPPNPSTSASSTTIAMPADYSSTAKALALPISPIVSPSPERQNIRPPWSRRLSTGRHRSHSSPYSLRSSQNQSYQAKILSSASNNHKTNKITYIPNLT